MYACNQVTLDKSSSLLIFSSISEPRREALIDYAKIVGSEVISIDEERFAGILKVVYGNKMSELQELRNVFHGLETLYSTCLPKVDPVLLNDLLIREPRNQTH